jgi:rhodanese-related sulfurtransferase
MMNSKTQGFPLTAILAASLLLLSAAVGMAAEPATAGPSAGAKICLICHKPAPGNLLGNWEAVAIKSSSIQMKIDDRMDVFRFDPSTVQVLNAREKGDTEKMLRSIKNGAAVRVSFAEKDGTRYATVVSVMPPVKLPEQDRISLADMEMLVAHGHESGDYTLIDSRPARLFKEGSIPTAVSLPFPEFEKNLDRLPADKNRLVIFYCSGPACTMSPNSQARTKKLGYTKTKVFVGGMPEWLGKNYGMLTARSFQEAYENLSYVLLDAREPGVAEKGFAKGAVIFPAADEAAIQSLPKKSLNAPIIVYDEDGKGNGRKVASAIVKAGYTNTLVLSDGYAGMQQAGLQMEKGKLQTVIAYVPKPKPGEFPPEQFRKIIAAGVPADTILLDVRSKEEVNEEPIKGALNIPADDLEKDFATLPKDKNILTLCNTGTRAEMAYYILKAKGFAKVCFLNAMIEIDEGKPTIAD